MKSIIISILAAVAVGIIAGAAFVLTAAFLLGA